MAAQNRYKQFYTLGGKFVDATKWTQDMDLSYLNQHYGWEGVMAYGNLIHDDMNWLTLYRSAFSSCLHTKCLPFASRCLNHF